MSIGLPRTPAVNSYHSSGCTAIVPFHAGVGLSVPTPVIQEHSFFHRRLLRVGICLYGWCRRPLRATHCCCSPTGDTSEWPFAVPTLLTDCFHNRCQRLLRAFVVVVVVGAGDPSAHSCCFVLLHRWIPTECSLLLFVLFVVTPPLVRSGESSVHLYDGRPGDSSKGDRCIDLLLLPSRSRGQALDVIWLQEAAPACSC
jgi:hypothetical protein